jgi:hypothetical protein
MSDTSLFEPCSLALKLRLRCNGRGTCQKHSANGIAPSFIQVGHQSTSPAHRNKGHPGAPRLRRTYRGMRASPMARARPTTHCPTPSRSGATVGRAAQTQTPFTTGYQGMHQASLESDDIFEAANAEPDNMLSWQKRRPNEKDPYSSRYRSCTCAHAASH